MKNIETFYNGYHFRSRLEARWAVFFDATGIKYHYEYKDFVLENGIRYLPDFYLPDFDAFVEIKHEFDNISRKKCFLLNKLTKKIVLMFDGVPDFKEYFFYGTSDEKFTPENVGIGFTIRFDKGPVRLWVEPGVEYTEDFNDHWAQGVYASRAARFEFL